MWLIKMYLEVSLNSKKHKHLIYSDEMDTQKPTIHVRLIHNHYQLLSPYLYVYVQETVFSANKQRWIGKMVLFSEENRSHDKSNSREHFDEHMNGRTSRVLERISHSAKFQMNASN